MNKNENQRRALGKGLRALLPPRPLSAAALPPQDLPEQTLAIDRIDPNPLQPRRIFHGERLAELAQSIRSNGIIQPLVVRKAGDRYQLVAGERRWRAAQMAGMQQVPVVVQDVPDDRLLEITLIENIQREDLNPIEAANAFARLGQELGLSAEEIGKRTGKDRTTIVNFTRLLQLPRTFSNEWPNAGSRPATPAACSLCRLRNCSGKLLKRRLRKAGPCVRSSGPPKG